MSEVFSGRDTIVVEWQYPNEVGSDQIGYAKTIEYIRALFEELGVSTLEDVDAHPHSYVPKDIQKSISSSMPEPKAHLCGKYGFAGFGTGEQGVYGHAYFWDKHSSGYENEPPFGTMDVSFPTSLSEKVKSTKIVEHTGKFFDTDKITWKATNVDRQINDFIDFAPHIVRQRLLIQGILFGEINEQKITQCMEELCDILHMGKLSQPKIYNQFAFMHWEDSGTVASWTKEIFNIDIYTCKFFEVQNAVDFIQNKVPQNIIKVQSI